MEPSLRYSSKKKHFFTGQETRSIGAGIELWRGFFQSLRPAIDRMLINIDISTGAMYKSGRLIDLALEFLGLSTPNALRHGLPDRERLRLQQFISGIQIVMPYRDPDRRRLVRKVTRESAHERTFEIGDGQTMTVAQYFQNELNVPLQFPDLICVEVCTIFFLSSHPFSYHVALKQGCNSVRTLPGSTRSVRPQEHSPRQDQFDTRVLDDAPHGTHGAYPRWFRSMFWLLRWAVACLLIMFHQVLQYGQSQYVRQFGMNVSNTLVELEARVIKAPMLKYNPTSRQPNIVRTAYLSLMMKSVMSPNKATAQRYMEYVGYAVPTRLCHVIAHTFAGSIRKCLNPLKSQIGLS